jgi:hypothetical protein
MTLAMSIVPTYEIHNTTCGTLLVLKMCMKLVIYSSRTRGFDGQIFVVRTVNKLLKLNVFSSFSKA